MSDAVSQFSVCFFLLFAAVFSDSLPARELKLDNDSLAKFGVRKFRMVATDGSPEKPNEREVGTMGFSAKVEPESVNLVCRTRINSPDGNEFVDFRLSCHCSADGDRKLDKLTNVAEGQSDESSSWVAEQGVLRCVQINPRNRRELIE